MAGLQLGAGGAYDDQDVFHLPAKIIAGQRDRFAPNSHGDDFAARLGSKTVLANPASSDRVVMTLADTLRRAPGVMVQESFGGFEPPRLSIRGSGLNSAPTSRGVALLIDGLPLARADGAFHTGLFDPQLFSAVEVYRGSTPLALAPPTLGGAINALTSTTTTAPATSLHLTAGDYGALRGQAMASVPGAHAAAAHQSSDGWRPHSAQERSVLHFAARRNLTPATQVTVSTYAATANYEVPGPLTLAAALGQPRSVSAPVPRDQPRRSSSVLRAAVFLESATTTGEFTTGVYALRWHDDFRQLQPNGVSVLDAGSLGADVSLARRLDLGVIEHQVLIRVRASTGRDESKRYLNEGGQRGMPFAAYVARADNLALHVENVARVNADWSVGTGLTGLHGRRALTGRRPSPDLSSSLRYTSLSPRLGALWSPRPQWALHGAIAHGLEPPTFDDLVAIQGSHPGLKAVTRPLEPQSALTTELGLRRTVGRWDMSLTAYHGRWRREILRLADAEGLPRGAVNAGPTLHQGLETALRWRLVEGRHRLTLSATSTLGRFRFDDDPVLGRNRLAGLPPHTGTAEVSYEHPRGWFAALESTWAAGRTPVDHANRLHYDGHILGHVRLGWRPRADLTLVAAVRNLADHRHIASTAGVLDLARTPATTSLFLPGQGRTFTISATWHPRLALNSSRSAPPHER